jgi:hypothetical protein
VWEDDGCPWSSLLEYDLGTEPLGRLVNKLGGYEKLDYERGVATWLLFAFPSERREANACSAWESSLSGSAAVSAESTEGW